MYRKEIDGLRALAVLPVILFHAGFETFSGGFVGVDIFFVISGYLITTIIANEMTQGTFSLAKFYERRCRRILPALFFVLLCTIPFAWLLMIPSDLVAYSESLASVPLFISNIIFWLDTGYFSTIAEHKPLLHTWSLAVEEQYYVLFPLFLMLVWRWGIKLVISLLVLAAVISLAFAQWGSVNSPSFTFFMLPTRGFEILIGALIALYLNNFRPTISFSRLISSIGSFLGLALMLSAVLLFNKNTPSPSLYSLIPTIGAGLVLIFANAQNIAGKILGNKALVSIGLISYSTYLWHQPLLAFARLSTINNLGTSTLIILVIFSLILGYLSWKFIEAPFRNRNRVSLKTLMLIAIPLAISFVGLGIIGSSQNGFPNRLNIPEAVSNSIISSSIRSDCDASHDGNPATRTFCDLGDLTQADIDWAIFGDSHSNAMLPVFDKIGKDTAQKFTHLSLAGCPPLIEGDVRKGNHGPEICKNIAKRQYEYVKSNNIKNVFLIGHWGLYTDGDYQGWGIYYLVSDKNQSVNKISSRVNFKDLMKHTIREYQSIGANVHVLLQVPQQKISAPWFYSNLYWRNSDSDIDKIIYSSSISKAEHLTYQSYNRSVFKSLSKELDFASINPDEIFCDDDKCFIGNSSRSNYIDPDHLSVSGALSTYKLISNHLNESQ